MKKLTAIIFVGLCLSACTSSQYNLQDQQRNKALAILSDYTPSILYASALPLDFYCQHQQWPSTSQLDLNQELLAPLTGLSYNKGPQHSLIARFGLSSKQANDHFVSFWQLHVDPIDLSKKTQKQRITITLNNTNAKIMVLDYLDFKCPSETMDGKTASTTQSQ